MRSRLVFNIAMALMLARWKQTVVAAVGVTFSITMFITLLGFMNGLNGLLDGLILNRTPHIKLYNEIKPAALQPAERDPTLAGHYHMVRSVKPDAARTAIYNVAEITRTLKADPRVLGVAPKITAQVFYTVGTIDITGVINGIDVAAESQLYFFRDYVTTGEATDLKNVTNSIILGKGAADQMLADIGDIVQATTVTGNQLQLKVVGYFQSGLLDVDKVQSYTSLETAQKLLGEPDSYVTDLQVKLKDFEAAPATAREYARLFGVDAEDIQTANAQFETGSFVRTIISYAVGITLLIVAGFGIYNILNMMIYEKMDSIAILKATGFSGQDVKHIFLVISITIGVVGALLGLLFGYLLSSVIDQVPFETAALPNVKTYPVDYNPKFYIIGFLFALASTYLAGWLPARKASHIDPVDIIRGK